MGDQAASRRLGVLEFFDAAEQSVPVTEWTVDGLPAWPVLRNLLAFRLVTREFGQSNQIARYTKFGRVRQVLRSMARSFAVRSGDAAHNASIPPGGVDVVYLTISSTRFFKIDGEWYNPYSDSFAKHFRDEGLTGLDLETTSDGEYRWPRFGRSLLIQNKLFRLSLYSRFSAKLSGGEEKLPGFDDFLERYRKWFNEDPSYLAPFLRSRVRQTRYFRDYFRKLLAKARPGAALITGYSSTETMGLAAACRERGIPSIDVQHGVQGAEHFAYRAWKLPPDGYPLLPSEFWCWDAEAAASINRWASAANGRHRAYRGGNPCLELFARDGSPVGDAIAKKFSSGAAKVNILYTLQAFYELPGFVIEAMKRSPPEWRWWLRVHPQYWETREPIRKSTAAHGLTNFVIDEASDYPLASVLGIMDVHITEFSSSVLEAAELGVPSVVISERGRDLFPSQIASGIARYAVTTDTLLEAIGAQRARKEELARSRPKGEGAFGPAVRDLARRIRALRAAPAP